VEPTAFRPLTALTLETGLNASLDPGTGELSSGDARDFLEVDRANSGNGALGSTDVGLDEQNVRWSTELGLQAYKARRATNR
jgi:hypothetical protein